MSFSYFVRMHWAAFRALLVLTVITGIAYPLFIWLVAQIPGLHDKAEGSILTANGKPVGSRLIGQLFTDKDGNPLPQYFQSRPSAAGNGYDPLSSGASNLGPESIVDTSGKPSLLTTVCSRSAAVGLLERVDGSRPFCTGGGVGAVLSVIGPRDARGNVVHPTRVVSVNEPCQTTQAPFLTLYEGVRVECAKFGEDYAIGQIVPIRGTAPAHPAVPADAVTASGSGLDPNISPAYADLQVARVAKARHVSPDQIREVLAHNRSGRTLGFFGEPCVNVLQLNLQLDHKYPVSS
ncbi:potassium-transporting ATPase subunit C [Mycobacterium nebraskense]|uniref:Potassium-transporting ATPase KdpC subunit n=1 Tax=Mycobacterium nebraskense TaxID=244292 RepID=A0A0F5NBS1_9MYCO|nr:potassium-transporting ATPase subunit C [Mycobacterium nebraskense]KKC03718.1 potassium ABC transporter ATPase [Mycobacterium nebraskense]KLO34267.1 potassium ABC transporter ATPase [Mycobacterium nebraskense]MBI2693439.1 potassium-transporting ATPase subunit C [Mycobacterium nebraskense]MCV7117456.1 potassium-transporting ATPase subunit C [Mycobacterium nebraskense]ORW22413.1 K+-transporting ATPase subunit C [Mycobacterium nebraskense]